MPKESRCKPLSTPQTRTLKNLNFHNIWGVNTDPQNALKNKVCEEKMKSGGDQKEYYILHINQRFGLGAADCLRSFLIFFMVTIMNAPSLHS